MPPYCPAAVHPRGRAPKTVVTWPRSLRMRCARPAPPNRLREVVVRILVDDHRRAVLVQQHRHLTTRDRHQDRDELRPRSAVAADIQVRQVAVVRTVRMPQTTPFGLMCPVAALKSGSQAPTVCR